MGILKKIRQNRIYKFLEQNRLYRRGLYVLIFTLLVVLLASSSMIPNVLDLKPGDVSPVNIEADRFLSFIDEEATTIKRNEVASKVKTVYRMDDAVLEEYKEQIRNISGKVRQILDDNQLLLNQKVNILSGMGFNFTLVDVENLRTASDSQFNALNDRLEFIIASNFSAGVTGENILFIIDKIRFDIEILDVNPFFKKYLLNLANTIRFVPNLVPDPEATQREVENQLAKVDPVRIVIQKNERIAAKGDVLTAKQVEIINWLGYGERVNRAAIYLGVTVYTLLFITMISLFLSNYRAEMYQKDKNILLLMVLFFLALVLIKIFTLIQTYSTSLYAPLVNFLIPSAAVSMLIAILLDDKLAYISAAIISIYVGLLTEEMAYVYTSFIGSFVGVYLVAKINQRGDLIKAGTYISLANCVSIVAWLLTINEDYSFYVVALLFGAINGFLATVLTIGILPYLEDFFGKTTIIKLLELFNPNHPLLKQMILEAPGTYHHSIMLGNLAEGAAEAINANSVLVRVGAVYHDIGKLKRPYFYIENQGAENPHDKLAPSLSAIILQAHVKEGVELGRKYKIPQKILDFIPMHHGTSLMKYFYHKAKESNPDVMEDDYRYEGPKPNTKETAILMLADSTEAAVKSIKDINAQKIEIMVRNVVKDKLYDGQLDESELTLKEIETIIKTFTKILQGMYHNRIEYPEGVLKEMKKQTMDGKKT